MEKSHCRRCLEEDSFREEGSSYVHIMEMRVFIMLITRAHTFTGLEELLTSSLRGNPNRPLTTSHIFAASQKSLYAQFCAWGCTHARTRASAVCVCACVHQVFAWCMSYTQEFHGHTPRSIKIYMNWLSCISYTHELHTRKTYADARITLTQGLHIQVHTKEAQPTTSTIQYILDFLIKGSLNLTFDLGNFFWGFNLFLLRLLYKLAMGESKLHLTFMLQDSNQTWRNKKSTPPLVIQIIFCNASTG